MLKKLEKIILVFAALSVIYAITGLINKNSKLESKIYEMKLMQKCEEALKK